MTLHEQSASRMDGNVGRDEMSFMVEHHMRFDRPAEIFFDNRPRHRIDMAAQAVAHIHLLARDGYQHRLNRTGLTGRAIKTPELPEQGAPYGPRKRRES